MRLSERVYLVGGGTLGFGISDQFDSHVYLLDGGDELALIDSGAGVTIEPILANLCFDRLDERKLRYVLLTHAHADHAGGALSWHERFGADIVASPEAADYVRAGDEEKISLSVAKRGGFYPVDYRFRACPVAHELRDGDVFRVGNLAVTVLETPGHCSGMLSFLVNDDGRSLLFSGDTVFHSGKLLITNVWDCDLQLYVTSVEKIAALEFDALLPGHLAITMSGGCAHVRKASETLHKLAVPPNVI